MLLHATTVRTLSSAIRGQITHVTRLHYFLCYTVFDAIPRFAREAVIPSWIRFISAFPAHRLVPAPNLK